MITEPDWYGKSSNPNGIVNIGENTKIRELVIINKPTEHETYIGSNCYLMNRCFVGHDCRIGNNVQLNPGCSIAGFVTINDYSCIGMNASIHQHSKIGKCCIIGAGSFFKGETPSGITWGGVPAKPIKVNDIGIERSDLSNIEKELIIHNAKLFIDRFKASSNI
jgi:UDP-N-acetylglucosamine acyltransferase|tara:strand:- start:1146 stop:1637 length:492 start_codon:yes stop_codon:yes gene_type:complete